MNNFHGSYQDKVLSVYDGAKWNYVTEANGMDTITFAHLHSFNDGSVWCGSNCGAYKFVDLKPTKHFDEISGMLVENIPEAVPTAEGAWFATAYGLTHFTRSNTNGVVSQSRHASSGIAIWPNPCHLGSQNGRVRISCASHINYIQIVDELGRIVFSHQLPLPAEVYEFNPSYLPSGQYQVLIHSPDDRTLEASFKVAR